jgi:hypothetical protein
MASRTEGVFVVSFPRFGCRIVPLRCKRGNHARGVVTPP